MGTATFRNDSHNGALELHSMGMVFLDQGRFGAAVSNLSESVKGFQKAEDRSRLMVQVLIDYAEALAVRRAGAAKWGRAWTKRDRWLRN